MEVSRQLKVLIVASEIAPFAKSDAMADEIAALSRALHAQGADVRLVLPRYAHLGRDTMTLTCEEVSVPLDAHSEPARVWQGTLHPDLPVYFIDQPRLFERERMYLYDDDAERFIFFGRAVL